MVYGNHETIGIAFKTKFKIYKIGSINDPVEIILITWKRSHNYRFVNRTTEQRKMKRAVAVICFSSVMCLAFAQFPNGRILEPPVPALCAERTIHERAPDGKG